MRSTVLKLDREYELRFDTMALLRLEREFGKPIVEALKEVQRIGVGLSLDGLFTLLRCANKDLCALDVEKIAGLIDDHAEGESTIEKFRAVMTAVIDELNHSMVGDEKKILELQEKALAQMQAMKDSTGDDTKNSLTPSG